MYKSNVIVSYNFNVVYFKKICGLIVLSEYNIIYLLIINIRYVYKPTVVATSVVASITK